MDETKSVQERKFVTLEAVQKVFSISSAQAYTLVRTGEIRAIRVGGRKVWRVEERELERYIERSYFDAERPDETDQQ